LKRFKAQGTGGPTVYQNPKARPLAILAAAATAGLLLSACGGTSASSGASAKQYSLTINDDNHVVQQELTSLSTGACKAQNQALPLKIQTVPIGNVDEKVQLLGGQGALPVQFAAGNAPALTKSLDKAGQVLDLEKTLKDLGVWDDIQPAAVKTVENLYGKFDVMPYQLNIEGIWYNKKLFTQNNIAVPTSYDELVAAAAKFKSAGITPFSASGVAGWPITRLIGSYLYRELGPDALQAVADGKAKLTDPQYVKAAQAVADLGKAGYFGKGVGSIDYDTAVQQFLTGKAAMFYMGSWILGELNDPSKNQIGLQNVGFFPFPGLNGKGLIPMNAGQPTSINPKKLTAGNEAWLAYIAKHYGDEAMRQKGQVTGFVVHKFPKNLSPATKMVVQQLANAKNPVLWFEALMSAKATTVSQQDAAPLATGQMSAQAFMAAVQQAIAG
jgi:raffinose/stachyose/melibiose transport system substrate-binding protein